MDDEIENKSADINPERRPQIIKLDQQFEIYGGSFRSTHENPHLFYIQPFILEIDPSTRILMRIEIESADQLTRGEVICVAGKVQGYEYSQEDTDPVLRARKLAQLQDKFDALTHNLVFMRATDTAGDLDTPPPMYDKSTQEKIARLRFHLLYKYRGGSPEDVAEEEYISEYQPEFQTPGVTFEQFYPANIGKPAEVSLEQLLNYYDPDVASIVEITNRGYFVTTIHLFTWIRMFKGKFTLSQAP